MKEIHVASTDNCLDCPFCKTLQRGSYFAKSKYFVAIYNIAPILPGHSLIIPKKHIVSVNDLSEMQLKELFTFTRKVTSYLCAYYKTGAFDWSLQDGIAAGQTIPHIHIHIVPRTNNDLGETNEWYKMAKESNYVHLDSANRKKLNQEEYLQITTELYEFVKNNKPDL